MTNGKVPEESKRILDWIINKFTLREKKVMAYYWGKYNDPQLGKLYKNDAAGQTAKHEWARRMTRSEFEGKTPTEEKNVFFFGKGSISFEPPSCRLWVYDVNSKQKSCITLKYDVIATGFLDEFVLFQNYKNIELVPGSSEGWMGLDDRSLPLPDPEPLMRKGAMLTPSDILTGLKIKKIRIADLNDLKNWSRRTSDGKGFVYSDLRCIPNVLVTSSGVNDKEYKGFKYKSGYMRFTDHSVEDGFTLENGVSVPGYLTAFIPESAVVSEGSTGNIYGAIRFNKNKKLAFEFAYFDPILK